MLCFSCYFQKPQPEFCFLYNWIWCFSLQWRNRSILQDPDFQNRLCKQDFVDVLFILKGNCTCRFYKTNLAAPPESVFLSKHSFCIIPHQVIHSFSPDPDCQILHIFSSWILWKVITPTWSQPIICFFFLFQYAVSDTLLELSLFFSLLHR